jgi:hypothetical protein
MAVGVARVILLKADINANHTQVNKSRNVNTCA